jgi:3,4-dihydroxy-2-butanone 4-phosphate synthase
MVFRKEDDCGEEYRSGEVEEHVLHGVAQGLAARERNGFVEGSATLKELLGVQSEHAVCDIFHHFPKGPDGKDKTDYPHESECA